MVKERISLTLDSEVVDRLDRRLEEEGIENRSRGVEKFLREYLEQEAVSRAVVLGGGRDSSCLTPVEGKPAIEHSLDLLREAGVEDIVVATADPEVKEHLEDEDVELLFEEAPLGTAGSLRKVDREREEPILVMNGDVVCEVDIDDMYSSHRSGDGIATVALTTVEDASPYGVIRMKGDRIVGFREKPEETESHLVNAGIYLLDPGFMERIPSEEEERQADIESVFETLAEEGLLNGYVYEGDWREAG